MLEVKNLDLGSRRSEKKISLNCEIQLMSRKESLGGYHVFGDLPKLFLVGPPKMEALC